jgi:ABC-type multidrug transport system fused ATPase/permease subunit
LNNIKTLKFYQWIGTFQKEVEKRRMTEQKSLYRIIHILCYVWAFSTLFPAMMSTLTFYTSILFGHTIDLATAFTALIFFDLIRGPLEALPWIINSLLELTTSMKRVQVFLDEEELTVDNFLVNLNDYEDQEDSEFSI